MPKKRFCWLISLLGVISLKVVGSYRIYDGDEEILDVTPGTEGYFWQISDIHWDQKYSSHGDPSDMCHAPHPTVKNPSPKPYGDYSCDSPYQLVEAALSAMQEEHSQPDFVLWTGDITPHVKDPVPDWSVVFSSLRNVTGMLRERFPNNLLLPVLGNHDAFPQDVYPDVPGTFYHGYLDQGGWARLLPPSAQAMFAQCGFYSIRPSSKLDVLVLNTNLYGASENTTIKTKDPCGQFKWLENHLRKALAENHRVVIAAHIPPGYFERWADGAAFYHPQHQQRYVDLLTEYGEVIMAQVYGHTHTDSFRLMQDKNDRVRSVGFVAPSVTPWLHTGGVNPSIRLYSYAAEPEIPRLLDYWQFFLNISALHSSRARVHKREIALPSWALLYRASEAYNIPDLTVSSMHSAYEKLMQDPELFELYYQYNTVGHVFQPCNTSCRQTHLCVMSSLNDEALKDCLAGKRSFLRRPFELSVDEQPSLHAVASGTLETSYPMITIGGAAALVSVLMVIAIATRTRRSLEDQQRLPLYKHTPRWRYYVNSGFDGIPLADPVHA